MHYYIIVTHHKVKSECYFSPFNAGSVVDDKDDFVSEVITSVGWDEMSIVNN